MWCFQTCFLNNPEKEKKYSIKKNNHIKVLQYNKTIKDEYLFMKDEHAHFFLLLNPENKTYDGAVLKIDGSGVIDLISTNPFNYLTDFEKMELQIYGLNIKKLINDFKTHFGVQNFSLDYNEIDKISEQIDAFY